MYIFLPHKVSHATWRKVLKKERRRIKRKQDAQRQDEALAHELHILMSDETYVQQLREDEELARRQEIIEEQRAFQRREEWKARDLAIHSLWLLKQEKYKKIENEKKALEDKIRKEFEAKVEKENVKKNLEAKKSLLQEATSQLGNGTEVSHNPEAPPGYVRPDLRPKGEVCPFFVRTGACRFGVNCSREHEYPETSRTILLPNMYTRFGMEGTSIDEFDADSSLEYSESDSYMHFKDFFEDVVPEFEKIGQVVQFKTCKNRSPHLRGNVYVQFRNFEEAKKAITLFNGRWYAGRQISCVLVPIERWKSAICGLYWSRKCPKGDQCNFLHVYQNPGNAFYESEHNRFGDLLSSDRLNDPSSTKWRSTLKTRAKDRTNKYKDDSVSEQRRGSNYRHKCSESRLDPNNILTAKKHSRSKSPIPERSRRRNSPTSERNSRRKSSNSERSSRRNSPTSERSSKRNSSNSERSPKRNSSTSERSSRRNSPPSERSSRRNSPPSERSSRRNSPPSERCSRRNSPPSERSSRRNSSKSEQFSSQSKRDSSTCGRASERKYLCFD